MVDRGSPVDGERLSGYIRKTREWTIVGNVLGEYHPASFVDFIKNRRIVAATKLFVHNQLSILFQWHSKVVNRVMHLFPRFYIVFIYY